MRQWLKFSEFPSEPASLLVVTSDDLLPALPAFAEHKARIGVSCVVVSMTMIRRDLPGADDAERVKRLINQAYQRLGTRYVMIAGDAAEGHVPVRYRYVRQPAGTAVDASYNPTDHYYGDLLNDDTGAFNTWDSPSSPDGRYNEQLWGTSAYTYNPDGVKGLPDIAVGRVPAHDAGQLATYIQKVIAYETGAPDPGWCAFFANGTLQSDVCDVAETIVSGLGNAPVGRVKFGLHLDAAPPAKTGWVRGAFDDVLRAFNAAGWVSYLGHGAPNEWASCIGFRDASRLPNNRNFPVVMSSGCETGEFAPNIGVGVRYRDLQGQLHRFELNAGAVVDAENGSRHATPFVFPMPAPYDIDTPAQGRSMASAFLFANAADGSPSGGMAYMGEMVGMQCTNANDFQASVLKAFYRDGLCMLGDVWRSAQTAYWEANRITGHNDVNFDPPRIYLSIMTLFGDPTLRLRKVRRMVWKNSSGRFSVWSVNAAGEEATYMEHPPMNGWTLLGCSTYRFLWRHSSGKISLWRLDDQGNHTLFSEHGPFDGWSPVHCTDDWMLWTGKSNRISLWKLTYEGNQASFQEYDAPANCVVVNCCRSMILWRRNDGAAVLWRIDGEGNRVSEVTHGPIAGWTPDRVVNGRLLWRGTAGQVSVWSINENGNQISYGEYALGGWTPLVLTDSHLLWRNQNGTLSLWRLNEAGGGIDFREYPPIPGWDIFTYAE